MHEHLSKTEDLKTLKMKIKEITSYQKETKTIIDDFLKLLINKNASISESMTKNLIASDNSHLFFAFDESENCMGMLTLGIYISPSGKKAWVEDVTVGEPYQGQGIGEKMMKFATDFAKERHVKLLMLTSNPKRVAANSLYKKMGFEIKETNVYNMVL